MRATSQLLPVAGVEAGALRLRSGGLRAVLECPTLAFGIKDGAEQRAVVDGWTALLNSLTHPLQVLIRTRAVPGQHSLAAGANEPPALTRLRESQAELMTGLAVRRQLVSRRFFVVVPWDPTPLRPIAGRLLGRRRASAAAEDGEAALDQRVVWVSESLRRIDLPPVRLSAPQLTALFLQTLCPETAASQPVHPEADLDAWPELVSPAAFEEQPAQLRIGNRWARAFAVSRYPIRLQAGWLASLQTFEGDLDASLHIQPAPSQAVMSFLDRRAAELGSTLRLEQERGRRGDPYRRAALEDAENLQDRLARGEERLFDAALYLTAWADGAEELESATGRLEALLGTRMLQSRRLLFRMAPALTSVLPLAADPVGLRRSLTTSALAATFPFIGNDLRDAGGLLYGVNPAAQSPVMVDRFRLENHNAVVFATSGAGKSYLVKVELIRARLAGIRTQVIDPEGEYTAIVEALGGSVVRVSPGQATGLEPFAVPGPEAGALSSRIAFLLTLVDLLAGGLTANQRAAAEDAISFAYAAKGFADDGLVDGLTPPRLDEVQTRLRLRAQGAAGILREELDQLVLRLARYIGGAGSWLFRGGEKPAQGPAVAYALNGLPEEDRAVAMFLVLDRIWRDLRPSDQPTLVVLDEAWWLMQYPDTARFLFRLAKTARKRRAGLTLVTQDVGDVLGSPLGEPVVTNSALQVLMKQSPQAMPQVAQLFRLTPAEQSWLLNARPGEGLLLASAKRVPFQAIASDEEARLIESRPPGMAA